MLISFAFTDLPVLVNLFFFLERGETVGLCDRLISLIPPPLTPLSLLPFIISETFVV